MYKLSESIMYTGVYWTQKTIFIEILLVDQLKVLFNRKGFYNDLKHRFTRKKHNDIEDIYDGEIYQKHALVIAWDPLDFR